MSYEVIRHPHGVHVKGEIDATALGGLVLQFHEEGHTHLCSPIGRLLGGGYVFASLEASKLWEAELRSPVLEVDPEFVLGDRTCGDCAAEPGAFHSPGCDVERCPRCKGQMISCKCVWIVNGMLPEGLGVMEAFTYMEENHPEEFNNGPTPEMYAKWDAEWGSRRLRWTGEWPGKRECRALGFYCRDLWKDTGEVMVGYDFDEIRRRGVRWHVPCGPDDEGAHEDLNRWAANGCPEVP